MVRIALTREGNYYKSMEMSGHANFDEYGRDIVCAAASVLGFTFVNYITEVLSIRAQDYKLEVEENEESSYLYMELLNDYKKDDIQNGFKFFEIGIIGLIESYKNHIELIYQEV